MDSANSYGVHPFWPFFNDWLYGDTMFIIEPLLWVAGGAPLLFIWRTRMSRLLVGMVLAGGVALSLATDLVPSVIVVVLVLFTLVLLVASKVSSPGKAISLGLAAWLGVTGVFIAGGALAQRRIEAAAAQHFPEERVLDHAMWPMPINPLCWEVLLMQSVADRYTVRRAMISLAPHVMAANQCHTRPRGPGTAPMTELSRPGLPAVHWQSEFAMARSTMTTITAGDCEAAAFMRFARVPWLLQRDGQWILGDLRFDRDPELEFMELDLGTGRACPKLVPPWTAPREDLLRQDFLRAN
jgi:inner membrane protein